MATPAPIWICFPPVHCQRFADEHDLSDTGMARVYTADKGVKLLDVLAYTQPSHPGQRGLMSIDENTHHELANLAANWSN